MAPTENEYATPHSLGVTNFVKPPPPVRSTTTSVTTTATSLFEPHKPRPGPPSSSGTGASGPTSLPVYVATAAGVSGSGSIVNNARHSTPFQGGGGGYLIEDEAAHGSASLPVSGHDFFQSPSVSNSSGAVATCLPSQEEVVRRTEAITRCIQELVSE